MDLRIEREKKLINLVDAEIGKIFDEGVAHRYRLLSCCGCSCYFDLIAVFVLDC